MDGSDRVEMQIGRRTAMTHKAVRALAERRLAVTGSNLSTVIIARIVDEAPGLSQRQIAERMHVQAPTIVRHLDRMEAEGLITRTRGEADRRVQQVHLTAKGRRARTRLEAVTDATSASLTEVFTANELAAFEEYLDRLAARAHDLLAEEAST